MGNCRECAFASPHLLLCAALSHLGIAQHQHVHCLCALEYDDVICKRLIISMTSFNFADENEMIVSNCTADSRRKFDNIIGTVEEIIISREFQLIQHNFLEKYYLEFEDTEENKFSYTDIFQEYGKIIESNLVEEMNRRIPDFSMARFTESLNAHKNEITDEIFEMFGTFTDFLAFKEMFLDYRAEKEGRNVNLMDTMIVHSIAPTHTSVVTSS